MAQQSAPANGRTRLVLRPLRCGGVLGRPRDAPISPALERRRLPAMVRSCQCSANVAISASKSGHRVDAGLTREVENEQGNLDPRSRHWCVYRWALHNGDGRDAIGERAGIGEPSRERVTLRPP